MIQGTVGLSWPGQEGAPRLPNLSLEVVIRWQRLKLVVRGSLRSCSAHAWYRPQRASPESACFPRNVSCALDVDSPVAHCRAVWMLMSQLQ